MRFKNCFAHNPLLVAAGFDKTGCDPAISASGRKRLRLVFG